MPARRSRRRGVVAVLIIVALLVGAGAVVAWQRPGVGIAGGVGLVLAAIVAGVALLIFLIPGLAPLTVILVGFFGWFFRLVRRYGGIWRLRLVGVSAPGLVRAVGQGAPDPWSTESGDGHLWAEVDVVGASRLIRVRLTRYVQVGDPVRVRYVPRRPELARQRDYSPGTVVARMVAELGYLMVIGVLVFLVVLIVQ